MSIKNMAPDAPLGAIGYQQRFAFLIGLFQRGAEDIHLVGTFIVDLCCPVATGLVQGLWKLGNGVGPRKRYRQKDRAKRSGN